jgi:ABC-2 type transport system permease protein
VLTVPDTTARIYDVRYQRYEGATRTRPSAVWSFARSGWLRALGIRRAATAKIWPFLLVTLAFAPVIVVIAIPAFAKGLNGGKAPTELMSYAQYLNVLAMVVVVFVASTIPMLLTKDRRDRVLSLYFSTSMSRLEYVVGRALSSLWLVLMVTLLPMLLLFLGSVLVVDHPGTYFRHHVGVLPRVLLAGLLVAVYQAAVGMAVGAMTARRVFAVGTYLALMLVSSVLGGILAGTTKHDNFLVVSLFLTPYNLVDRVLDDEVAYTPWLSGVAYAAVVLLCAGVVAVRYARKGGQE